MEKDFDKWNNEKKTVDIKEIEEDFFYHEREIWWCSAGLNIGVEANGKHENFERPMLVLKKFNKQMFWALPMTTKGKENDFYYKLLHEEIDSWAVLSQIKTLSAKRLLRKLGTVFEVDFLEIRNKVKGFLNIESSLAGAFSEAEATNVYIINEKEN